MPIAIAFAFSGYLDQVITFSIVSGLLCYVLIPFSLLRFRKMFPSHINKIRPFVSPLQPWISYFAIIIAITIMSTLFWGYRYNLIFALVFYLIAYFYFHNKHKKHQKEFDWQREMGWPNPSHHNIEE
jgi:ethanolamine permease